MTDDRAIHDAASLAFTKSLSEVVRLLQAATVSEAPHVVPFVRSSSIGGRDVVTIWADDFARLMSSLP